MTFVGEIRLFAFDYAPVGWLQCNGQLIQVALNRALYSLLGNTFGGVPDVSFNLPDLRGRVICGPDSRSGITAGQQSGNESFVMTMNQMAAHSHSLVSPQNDTPKASSLNGMEQYPGTPNTTLATLNTPGIGSPNAFYNAETPYAVLNIGNTAPALENAGTANPQPISLMQSFVVLNYCICNIDGGIYPPRN